MPASGTQEPVKRPINIPVMFNRIETAIASFAEAAMFDLAKRGYTTLFQQLVACIISIRTRDEVSLSLALALLETAPSAQQMARLSPHTIDALIAQSTFHEAKARQIHTIAQQTVRDFDGELPCERSVLLSFHGVGPKCANLALGVACGAQEISVDVHVNRVTTRWGYVSRGNAEHVRRQLEERLPKKYWTDINRLLVPFGKHICTGHAPKCSRCPVLEYCQQIGVKKHQNS